MFFIDRPERQTEYSRGKSLQFGVKGDECTFCLYDVIHFNQLHCPSNFSFLINSTKSLG